MPKRLEGKNIFVTGASRGIGAGIAHFLAAEGARLALGYSSSAAAAEKVLAQIPGSGHILIKMNIASEADIASGFEQIIERFETLHGLVNNAGITRDGLLLRMKTEAFDEVINTNLRGTFLCTKAALKVMLKARAGSIVNITSVTGQSGNPGQTNYAASKAGIEAFTKSAALEVASRNIRVNCVSPGFIETEMTGQLSENQKSEALKEIPLGAFGQPEDVACAVGYLLSDESRYVTGQTISVNGGLYM